MGERTSAAGTGAAVLTVALLVVVGSVALQGRNPTVRTPDRAGVVAGTRESGADYVVTFEDGTSVGVPLDHDRLLGGNAPQPGDVVLVGSAPRPWIAAVPRNDLLCPTGGYLAFSNGTVGSDYVDLDTEATGVIRLPQASNIQPRYPTSGSRTCAVCLDATGEVVEIPPACGA